MAMRNRPAPKTDRLLDLLCQGAALGSEFVSLLRSGSDGRRPALLALWQRVEALNADIARAAPAAHAAWANGEERTPSPRVRLRLVALSDQVAAQIAEAAEWLESQAALLADMADLEGGQVR